MEPTAHQELRDSRVLRGLLVPRAHPVLPGGQDQQGSRDSQGTRDLRVLLVTQVPRDRLEPPVNQARLVSQELQVSVVLRVL